MKKNIRRLAVLALCCSLLMGFPVLPGNAMGVEKMPMSRLPMDELVSEMRQNAANFEIHYIGDDTNKFSNTDELEVALITDTSLSSATTSKKTSKDSAKVFFIDSGYVESAKSNQSLQAVLDKGYLIFFETENQADTDAVLSSITGFQVSNTKIENESAKREGQDEYVVNACFVAKNKAGEYLTGTLYIQNGSSQTEKETQLLISAWEERNLYYYTKSDANASKLLTLNAAAYNGDMFTVNYTWKYLMNWHKNSWQSSLIGGNPFTLSEWICFLGVRADDGSDYYAWCVESYATPRPTTLVQPNRNFTKKVVYASNARYDTFANGQLRAYEPKFAPNSSTVSFSIGSDVAKDGVATSIGASFPIDMNEYTIVNDSQMGNELARINYLYSVPIFYTSPPYAAQETINTFSVIIKNNANTSTFKFQHYRSMIITDNFLQSNERNITQSFYATLNRPSK